MFEKKKNETDEKADELKNLELIKNVVGEVPKSMLEPIQDEDEDDFYHRYYCLKIRKKTGMSGKIDRAFDESRDVIVESMGEWKISNGKINLSETPFDSEPEEKKLFY